MVALPLLALILVVDPGLGHVLNEMVQAWLPISLLGLLRRNLRILLGVHEALDLAYMLPRGPA